MGHYKSNVRDLEFNLFEVFGRREILGSGPYADVDEDTARTILEEADRLATGVLADSFEEGDRHPPVFDAATSTVTLPEGVKKSYRALIDGGWSSFDLPAELGGAGIPRSLAWATAELVAGSNTGGLRSPSSKESASTPVASRLTSSRIVRATSSSTSAKGPVPRISRLPNTSNRLNSRSRRLLL
jgi:hypothetical protein